MAAAGLAGMVVVSACWGEVSKASAIMSYIAKGPEQMGFCSPVHILTVLSRSEEDPLRLSLGLSAPNLTSCWKTRKEGLAVDLAWET